MIGTPLWENARVVALYIAVRGEMDTSPLLAAAWDYGKTVLLPYCEPRCEQGGEDRMRFAPCPGRWALEPGRFGIPEPLRPQRPEDAFPDAAAPDCIVVPGLAFDRQGFRLGQGGGFYDRLFARPEYAACPRIGLAYAFQIIEALPHDVWDAPVHAVCSEEVLLWIPEE